MSGTEDAYRRALRWYPEQWRRSHGDAVVGTLLDQADAAVRSAPTIGERLDLATHGLLERARHLTAISSGVRDRASAIALATGAMFSVTMIGLGEVNGTGPIPPELFQGQTFGPFASPAVILYATWIAAWLLDMIGLARSGTVLLAATIPIAVTVRIAADANAMWLRPNWTVLGFLIMLALIALPGMPGRSRRGAGWIAIGSAAALVAFASPLLVTRRDLVSTEYFFLTWPVDGFIGWLPGAALLIAIALRLSGQVAWAGATLLAAVPWTLLVAFGGRDTDEIVTTLATAALVAAALAVGALLLRLLGLRIHITTAKR